MATNPRTEGVTKLEEPTFQQGKAMVIAGLRGHFTPGTWDGIPALWQRLATHGSIPGAVGRVHYGLCFNLSNGIDYLCGVEVSNTGGLPDDFTTSKVPAQKYAVFPHRDHVSKLHDTLDAIQRKWLPASGHKIVRAADGAPDFFERYGEGFDPKTGMGDIEVWLPIQS